MSAPRHRPPGPMPIFELRIGGFHATVQHMPPLVRMGIFVIIDTLLGRAGTGWFRHL